MTDDYKPHARTHTLKVMPPYFAALWSGEKTFEVRRDDRGFQRDDFLHLQEYTGHGWGVGTGLTPALTGREVHARITWILTGGQFGIAPGYVVMALSICGKIENAREDAHAPA